ncbi:MAG: acetyl CoA synthetase subunit alpha [Bdellovibrionales bacterium RIFOXYD1_FULL_55_31]|nr:MAG: acetyl CoA synthetase subunit alpha [Bdellovibrionales bacterium RIFOXYD1_FULL_55_31]
MSQPPNTPKTSISPDPSNDYLRAGKNPLDSIFHPKSVAVVGATEKQGSVGRTILWNLLSNSFGGTIYPINPKRPNVLGIKAYPDLRAVPDKIDLAVIVTPATAVPAVMEECVAIGVKGAIVISAGFKETGPEGLKLEQDTIAAARRGGIRVIGPNCLGVMSPITGLNATFATALARPGNVGFISQSGALCTAVLDWSFRENVGFSSFMSIGSMADVDWGDLIYYLGDDPNTKSIVIYMETIGNANSFLAAAREVALNKPIIVIKAGRTSAAAKAAASHTGSLTGSDDVLDAAFQRCGVLRVNTIAELFYMAEVLSKQPRPKGPRMTIVTNAGGPGVLATDALISSGGELATPSQKTIEQLNTFLPAAWSHSNPLDVLGDADPVRYAKTLEIGAKDANSDGLLVILTPQAMTDPTQTAEHLKPYAAFEGKPVLASWMGGVDIAAGEEILNKAGIPTFPYPDTAAKVFSYMWKHSQSIQSLYEVPSLPAELKGGDATAKAEAEKMVNKVRASGRTILTEHESKQLLSMYGIPTVDTRIAKNESEAVKLAAEIGFPVVLKLYSETITHKTDVGGVQLNLREADSVRAAFKNIEKSVREKVGAEHFLGVTVQPMIKLDGYEIILGSSQDPQFGPVLLFGMGGQLVEVYKDSALALPPLNTTLARRMMEKTKVYTALKGVRGRKPVDLNKLEQLLVRFSQLVTDQPWIKEIDINPMIAGPEMILALDARVVVYDQKTTAAELPKPAIQSYPTQYVSSVKTKNGTAVTLRPIRPEDEPLLVAFHKALSDASVYSRYAERLNLNERTTHERLIKMCHIDYDHEMALVATKTGTNGDEVIAAGRLSLVRGTKEAIFALQVTDSMQGQGVGHEMLRRLIMIAKDKKMSRVIAVMLPDNKAMKHICEREDFKVTMNEKDGVLNAQLSI